MKQVPGERIKDIFLGGVGRNVAPLWQMKISITTKCKCFTVAVLLCVINFFFPFSMILGSWKRHKRIEGKILIYKSI